MKKYHNERDVEIPLLKNFLTKYDGNYSSVLEVGCAFAGYTPDVRLLIGEYHGIDIIYDSAVSASLDKYIISDFLYEELPAYDLIFSVSVLEHIGVEYTPTKLHRELQMFAIEKMIRLARMAVFLTFPYGEAILFAGKFRNFCRKDLVEIKRINHNQDYKKIFISTPDPADPMSWREIPQELADKSTQGNGDQVNTVCVLEINCSK
jgi:hypothetical protein